MSPSSTAVHWTDPARRDAFNQWLDALAQPLQLRPATLQPASADASFRRYLRLQQGDSSSVIVMDAPPPLEDVRPFVRLARQMQAAGLHGPEVLAADEASGGAAVQVDGRLVDLPVVLQARRTVARAAA